VRKRDFRDPPDFCRCHLTVPTLPTWEESDFYRKYVDAFMSDMKRLYLVNGWPFFGLDSNDWEPHNYKGLTIDEVMILERFKLRPWGGPWGYKWPKLGETPSLVRLTSIPGHDSWLGHDPYWPRTLFKSERWTDEDSGWVEDSCPWYEEHLSTMRTYLWTTVHQFDDPDHSD
jgi:hypothetical protein